MNAQSHDALIAAIEAQEDIENIYGCICDLNGTLRGKRFPVDQAGKVLDGAIRMPLSLAGVDIWGEDVEDSDLVFETGDADGICQHTGRGIIRSEWGTRPTAMIPLWLFEEDGTAFAGDPRQALAAVVGRFKKHNLTPVVATELEFYLVDASEVSPQPPISPVTGKRLNSDGVLSLDDLEHFDGFLNDVYAACLAQGIQADAAISENGAGQFEINMTHVADPMRAADDAVLFKRLVRGVARSHGFAATFMAKPYGTRSGNGFHVHFSLLDADGNNVFDNGGDAGSDTMLSAVAGLLETMRENTLTFAPHRNSYRRLLPGAHSPSNVAWGYENRTAAIRIPGGDPKARRIEHRVAGGDANPYLVLASVLGGALLGMERELKPVAPITGDAYSLKLPGLPLDWASAIRAFETGDNVGEIFSTRLQKMFAECKLQEQMRFNQHVSELEHDSYLEIV
jgi:glutamine synthetase